MSIQTQQYCYLPTGWDAAWANAKSAIGSRKVTVTAIGDSITQGWMANDIMVDAWWPLLRSSILAANSNALSGDHYGFMYSQQGTATFGGPGTATYPLSVHGTINTDFGLYPGAYNYAIFNKKAISPLITFTSSYACVALDIIYINYTAGTWTYSIDGGSPVTVTTTGSGNALVASLKKISITGLPNSTHTITINAPNSTYGTCIIAGITTYANPTSGLCYANMGWPGMGLVAGSESNNNLASGGNIPVDRTAIYQGYIGPTGGTTANSGFGFPAQPDLAIIALGVNDSSASVTRASFRDGLDRLVWSLRYGKSDACSILIVGMWGPDGTLSSSSTVTNQDQATTSWPLYRDLRAAMIEVAMAEGCAYVDVHGAFGRMPVANGWIDSVSDIHPSSAGHTKIAGLLSALV